MKRLFIIGNGFDLLHDMKTKYMNYRDFLMQSGYSEIVEAFESNSDICHKSWWSALEDNIGIVNCEKHMGLLKEYGADDWTDDYHHAFQREIEQMSSYWPRIKELLPMWIKKMEYTSAIESIRCLITGDAYFLCFNYTNTLERVYGIEKKNIFYIHGDGSAGDDLVLGHGKGRITLEWDNSDPEGEDPRLINAGQYLDDFWKETEKKTNEVIDKAFFFTKTIQEKCFEKIYVMGLSYNDIDREYLKEIARQTDAEWVFFYYCKDDEKKIGQYAKYIGVNSFEKRDIRILGGEG